MVHHITDIQRFYSRYRVFLMADGMAVVPVRGPAFPFFTRCKDAWRVLTGRYDALSWDHLGKYYYPATTRNHGELK